MTDTSSSTMTQLDVAALQAEHNEKAQRALIVCQDVGEHQGALAARKLGRIAAEYQLHMPDAIKQASSLIHAYNQGFYEASRENIRARSIAHFDGVLASPDVASDFWRFACIRRMRRILHEAEHMLALHGYAFERKARSVELSDAERIAIGRILTNAVGNADRPLLAYSARERSERRGEEEGWPGVWADYLLSFLDDQGIGIVLADPEAATRLPLVEKAADLDALVADCVEIAALADATFGLLTDQRVC